MHRRHILLAVVTCFTMSGCSTITTPSLSEVFSLRSGVPSEFVRQESKSSENTDPDGAAAPDVPSFVVEMRGANNESQKFKRPLTDDATYVQGVLVQSNALKHFGRVKVELWRRRPDGNGYHKLDIPFDRKMKSVPPGYDYAIHEADRLVFMEDESNILDDMLGSLGR